MKCLHITKIWLGLLFVPTILSCTPSYESYLLLGDIHYDLLENHDIPYLIAKGDDYRQVTKEYTQFTSKYWGDFSDAIRKKSNNCDAVIQMGDISEGLAGTPELATQMAESVFKAINELNFEIPFIITKGNHDITGPGAKEAFDSVYIPNISRLAHIDTVLTSANYYKKIGTSLFVAYDPWKGSHHGLDELEKNLQAVEAEHKFVVVHEPVIPVNERCWHLLRRNDEERNRLLQIIASNNAIVLCAHLHLYSIVERDTEWGPIVQILVNSVIRDSSQTEPKNIRTEYGPNLALDYPDWQPESMDQRIGWLEEEAKYVNYFKVMDLPGHAIMNIDKKTNEINLTYYATWSNEPYETVNISNLIKK